MGILLIARSVVISLTLHPLRAVSQVLSKEGKDYPPHLGSEMLILEAKVSQAIVRIREVWEGFWCEGRLSASPQEPLVSVIWSLPWWAQAALAYVASKK